MVGMENNFTALMLGILVGMLMAFGLVLLFEFFMSPEITCNTSFLGEIRTLVSNL